MCGHLTLSFANFLQALLHCQASPLDTLESAKKYIDFTRTAGLISPRFDSLLASMLASRAPSPDTLGLDRQESQLCGRLKKQFKLKETV
jgi:hypothetical protein